MGGSASICRNSANVASPIIEDNKSNTPLNDNNIKYVVESQSNGNKACIECETDKKPPVNIAAHSGREMNLVQCLPHTPRGNDISVYPYYCPLCMEYFKDTLRTQCCGNYVCFPCASTYMQSKGIEVTLLDMN
jgi:hypothetical protein